MTKEEYLSIPNQRPEEGSEKVGDRWKMSDVEELQPGKLIYWFEIKSITEDNHYQLSICSDFIDGEAEPTVKYIEDKNIILQMFDENQKKVEANEMIIPSSDGWKTDFQLMRKYFEEFLDKTTSRIFIMHGPVVIGENYKPVKALTRKCKSNVVEDMLESTKHLNNVYIYQMFMTRTNVNPEKYCIDHSVLIRYGVEE